jgi:hypothetical protein
VGVEVNGHIRREQSTNKIWRESNDIGVWLHRIDKQSSRITDRSKVRQGFEIELSEYHVHDFNGVGFQSAQRFTSICIRILSACPKA